MIEESIYKQYVLGIVPLEDGKQETLWFVLVLVNILGRVTAEKICIPTAADLEQWELTVIDELHLGLPDKKPCYAITMWFVNYPAL